MSGAVQTTYDKRIGQAYAGRPYDLTRIDALTRFAEGSNIPFGRAVIAGSTPDKCRLPDEGNQIGNGATAATDIFLGVSIREHTHEQYPDAPLATPLGDDEISYYRNSPYPDPVGIARQGRIYVLVETAVAINDQVYFRVNNGTASAPLGSFTNATSSNHRLITSARYVTAAAAGGIAAIELNISI